MDQGTADDIGITDSGWNRRTAFCVLMGMPQPERAANSSDASIGEQLTERESRQILFERGSSALSFSGEDRHEKDYVVENGTAGGDRILVREVAAA